MSEFKTIGFIGVGVMGEPMCRHLATKTGSVVLASDLDDAPLERLASHGVQKASVADIASRADIIFMSLPSGKVVRALVEGDGNSGLLQQCRSGQVIVDLSTSPAPLTRELAQKFADRGIRFADAPVMRTRAAAEAGTLAVPVGAPDDLFELIQPLIACFARHHPRRRRRRRSGCEDSEQHGSVRDGIGVAEARAIGARAGWIRNGSSTPCPPARQTASRFAIMV